MVQAYYNVLYTMKACVSYTKVLCAHLGDYQMGGGATDGASYVHHRGSIRSPTLETKVSIVIVIVIVVVVVIVID